MKTLLPAASRRRPRRSPPPRPSLPTRTRHAPRRRRAPSPIPASSAPSERDNYRAVFADLRAQNWAGAAGRLDGMRDGAASRPRPGDALHHAGLAAGRAASRSTRLLAARARAAAGGRPRPPRPRARRREPARPARRRSASPAFAGQPRRARAAHDPRRRRRRRARAADPAPARRRPAVRGRGPAQRAQRRAHARGAHRLPAAHRLGLLSQRL